MAALVAVMIMVSVGTFDWGSVMKLRSTPTQSSIVMIATTSVPLGEQMEKEDQGKAGAVGVIENWLLRGSVITASTGTAGNQLLLGSELQRQNLADLECQHCG